MVDFVGTTLVEETDTGLTSQRRDQSLSLSVDDLVRWERFPE